MGVCKGGHLGRDSVGVDVEVAEVLAPQRLDHAAERAAALACGGCTTDKPRTISMPRTKRFLVHQIAFWGEEPRAEVDVALKVWAWEYWV